MVTVTCGATEAMVAGMLALLDPGDEVVIFEPYYENYGPDAILSGAVPRYVTLHEPDWSIDPDELRAAFGPRTRGLVLNSPHNPTGKVFTRAELELIASLCVEFDVIAFTDDIYEHIVFEGEHVPLATLPGMADRTVSIHSMSKSYSVTGLADRLDDRGARPHRRHPARPRLPHRGRGGPPAGRSRRRAGLPARLLQTLVRDYRGRRDALLPSLREAGFRVSDPAGAYYVMTDIRDLTDEDDTAYAMRLIREVGVAAVPGSSFYSRPDLGRTKLRFAFPKRLDTLRVAADRLVAGRAVEAEAEPV